MTIPFIKAVQLTHLEGQPWLYWEPTAIQLSFLIYHCKWRSAHRSWLEL
jgi:hypothetical protein